MKLLFMFLSLTIMLISFGCSCNCGQEDIDLEVHMKYGYADEVNTFENYLKKDLVQAGSADTTFSFSKEEKYAILEKANEVGFFDMPEVIEPTANFEQEPSPGKQMLRIKYEEWDNTVEWDMPIGGSEQEEKIKELSFFIINFIINSPEYEALPPAEGGYL